LRIIISEDLAKEVRNQLCAQKNVKILGEENDDGNFIRSIYVPNTDKIKNKFSVHEWTSLKDGIKRTAGFKENI